MSEKEVVRIRHEFAERLNEALDDAGMPPKDKGRQVATGKMFGISQKGARKWLEAESLPRHQLVTRIAAKLNVREEWLMFGLGPKRHEPADDGKFNTNLMQRIMVSVDKAIRVGNIPLTEQQKALLITSLYEDLSR